MTTDHETAPTPRAALALSILYAIIMLGGAVGHVASPEFYAPLVPPPIPLWFANVSSTIVEAAIGVMLLVPKTRRLGAIGFTLLMLAFVPIHVWDALKDQPAVGSHTAAAVRLVVQALFITGGVWLARRLDPSRR